MMIARRSSTAALCRVWTALSLHAISLGSTFLTANGYVTRPASTTRSYVATSTLMAYKPPDFTLEEDGDSSGGQADFPEDQDEHEKPLKSSQPPTRRPAPRRSSPPKKKMQDASWMQRNAAFTNSPVDDAERPSRSFREDFRGTRVFVQNIPPHVSWQDLKDHFRIAGEVVFASVSTDPATGESKGVGVVQYETTEMALNAIRSMRDHPLDGEKLYVREDVQEGRGADQRPKGPTPPSKWKCANEDNAAVLDETERKAILSLIKARDDARRRRKYDASDAMREQLKYEYNVHVDDRLKMWWTAVDGDRGVPASISDIKGDGRWGKQRDWRQIPTTLENDACVNADLVNGLLKQRDIARKEKDFATADALLEEARTSPDGDLNLRIHDESRSWRVWTDAPPPRTARASPAEQCIAIVQEYDPHKLEEMQTILEKFPGREYNILKKLKQRYNL